MKYSQRVEKALRMASMLHRGQLRKGDNTTPYIVHPMAVYSILAQYSSDEDVLIAGLLHDTVEDTVCTFDEIERAFGKRVSKIVQSVTEQKKDNGVLRPWIDRKKDYLNLLVGAHEDALLVAAADKIHNLMSMMYDYERLGEDMWKMFNAPPDKRLWFYREVLEIIKKKLHNPIVEHLEQTVETAHKAFNIIYS